MLPAATDHYAEIQPLLTAMQKRVISEHHYCHFDHVIHVYGHAQLQRENQQVRHTS